VLGIVAVMLGIVFEKQNIAFMVSLAFAVAASATLPVLFMSVLWKDCTTRGATIGGFLGLITAVGLTVVSKSVWVDVLGHKEAIFPYTSPALFSMTAGFAGIWLFSVLDKARASGSGRVRSAESAFRNRQDCSRTRAMKSFRSARRVSLTAVCCNRKPSIN
jgi:cation/acetate symporter